MAVFNLEGKVYGQGDRIVSESFRKGAKHCYLRFSAEEIQYIKNRLKERNVTLQDLICLNMHRKSSISNRLLFEDKEINALGRNIEFTDLITDMHMMIHATMIGGLLTYTVQDESGKSHILGLTNLLIELMFRYSDEAL